MLKLLALLVPIALICLPHSVNAAECQATVTVKNMEALTVFTFSTNDQCPDIYGFYLTPTSNDDITTNSSPQGWSGGGDMHNFVICTTQSNPVRSGGISGEFIVSLLGSGSHELNWTIADEDLMPVYWNKIVIESSS